MSTHALTGAAKSLYCCQYSFLNAIPQTLYTCWLSYIFEAISNHKKHAKLYNSP